MLPDDIIIQAGREVKQKNFMHVTVSRKKNIAIVYYYQRLQMYSRRNYAYQYPYQLEINSIRKAIPYFIGTHDFTSFCSAKTDKKDKVRTIYEIELIEQDDELIFRL